MASQTLLPGSTKEKREFKSPVRNLMRFFRASRDSWKKKCQHRKVENKRLKNHVNDVNKAKELWKQRAKAAEANVAELKAEAASLRARMVQLEDEFKKKRRSRGNC